MSLLKIDILRRYRSEVMRVARHSKDDFAISQQVEDIVVVTIATTEKSHITTVREYCNGVNVKCNRWTWPEDDFRADLKFEDEIMRALGSGYHLLPEGASVDIPGIELELDGTFSPVYNTLPEKSNLRKLETKQKDHTQEHRKLSV